MKRFVWLVVLVVVVAVQAQAAVIFDNGAPDEDVSWVSDFDFPNQVADDFSLTPLANTILDVHWWGIYFSTGTPGTDDFTIRIFEDNGGVPKTDWYREFEVGDVGRVDTGIDELGIYDIYQYETDIPATPLTAGTTYWLSIVNDTAGDVDDNWYWGLSDDGGGNGASRGNDGEIWTTHARNVDVAFQLTGNVVPEASTYLLFGLGTLGLMVWRKRKVR